MVSLVYPSPAHPSSHTDMRPRDLRLVHSRSHLAQPLLPSFPTSGSTDELAQAADDLRAFLRALFYFSNHGGMPRSYFIQMRVLSIALIVILVFGLAAIIKRLYQRTFWLFRIMRHPEGVYIVPNAVTTFCLVVGQFGILWIAYSWVNIEVLDDGQPQWRQSLWQLLTWIPLWTGAFWSGWGTFYASPNVLSRPTPPSSPLLKGRSWYARFDPRNLTLHSFIPRPLIINLLCLGTPVVVVVSVIIPTVFASREFERAYAGYLTLDNELAQTRSISQEDLVTAQEIFNTAVDSYWYKELTMLLWCIWGALFLVFYVPAGGYLVHLVRKQVKSAVRSRVTLTPGPADGIEGVSPGWAPEPKLTSSPSTELVGQQQASPSQSPASAFPQPLPPVQMVQMNSNFGLGIGLSTPPEPTSEGPHTTDEQEGEPTTTTGQQPQPSSDELEGEPTASRHSRKTIFFFPAVRPPKSSPSAKRSKGENYGSHSSRYKFMRRTSINLTIQYLAISSATLGFTVAAAQLAAGLYPAAYQNNLAPILIRSNLMAAWLSVVFGAFAVGAILSRTFDTAITAVDFSSTPRNRIIALPFGGRLSGSLPFSGRLSGSLPFSGRLSSSSAPSRPPAAHNRRRLSVRTLDDTASTTVGSFMHRLSFNPPQTDETGLNNQSGSALAPAPDHPPSKKALRESWKDFAGSVRKGRSPLSVASAADYAVGSSLDGKAKEMRTALGRRGSASNAQPDIVYASPFGPIRSSAGATVASSLSDSPPQGCCPPPPHLPTYPPPASSSPPVSPTSRDSFTTLVGQPTSPVRSAFLPPPSLPPPSSLPSSSSPSSSSSPISSLPLARRSTTSARRSSLSTVCEQETSGDSHGSEAAKLGELHHRRQDSSGQHSHADSRRSWRSQPSSPVREEGENEVLWENDRVARSSVESSGHASTFGRSSVRSRPRSQLGGGGGGGALEPVFDSASSSGSRSSSNHPSPVLLDLFPVPSSPLAPPPKGGLRRAKSSTLSSS